CSTDLDLTWLTRTRSGGSWANTSRRRSDHVKHSEYGSPSRLVITREKVQADFVPTLSCQPFRSAMEMRAGVYWFALLSPTRATVISLSAPYGQSFGSSSLKESWQPSAYVGGTSSTASAGEGTIRSTARSCSKRTASVTSSPSTSAPSGCVDPTADASLVSGPAVRGIAITKSTPANAPHSVRFAPRLRLSPGEETSGLANLTGFSSSR